MSIVCGSSSIVQKRFAHGPVAGQRLPRFEWPRVRPGLAEIFVRKDHAFPIGGDRLGATGRALDAIRGRSGRIPFFWVLSSRLH